MSGRSALVQETRDQTRSGETRKKKKENKKRGNQRKQKNATRGDDRQADNKGPERMQDAAERGYVRAYEKEREKGRGVRGKRLLSTALAQIETPQTQSTRTGPVDNRPNGWSPTDAAAAMCLFRHSIPRHKSTAVKG